MNKLFENEFVGLCFGYPPSAVFKQSIYTGFEEIRKKVNNADSIIDFYKKELKKTSEFQSAKSNLKWVLNKSISNSDIDKYFEILKQVIKKIEKAGLKN